MSADENQTENLVGDVEDVNQSEMETASAPVEDGNVDGETPMEESTADGGTFLDIICFYLFIYSVIYLYSCNLFFFFSL